MDRIIAPYGSAGLGSPGYPSPQAGPGTPFHAAKTARDYLRALRRRWWLTLAIIAFVVMPGVVFVLKLPAIYQAQAEIEIVPPQFDAALAVIVDQVASLNHENTEQFVLNKIAQTKSKKLIDSVVREFEPADPAAATALAAEITGGIVTKRVPGTNLFLITLDSRDQERVAKILNALLAALASEASKSSQYTLDESIRLAGAALEKLQGQLAGVDTDIASVLAEVPHFAPGGRNMLEEDFASFKSLAMQQRMRYADLLHERRLADMWPGLKDEKSPMHSSAKGQLGQLYQMKQELEEQIAYMRRLLRGKVNHDPVARVLSAKLSKVCDAIESIEQRQGTAMMPDLAGMNLNRAGSEIAQMDEKLEELKVSLHRTAPHYQRYLGLLKRREQLEQLIASTSQNLVKFQQVSGTLKRPVDLSQPATEPLAPVRPNRALGIVLVSLLGIFLGVGTVCMAEGLDRVVKVPEQLSMGLTLPLLAVVPRMRRMAQTHRGGHLWTHGSPDSIEADAFRNLRASLIGVERGEGPVVTVLVTSPKAGDGKSTIALNLAAACARAGERVILVDCDLRRPSLAEVFESDESLGLVDVLRHEMPWQRAIVRCGEIPNLSFMPAGHLGGAPIEILSSHDLKELIATLARHYHRVILDAPAVLGMADGRILGSLADATLLVVRSGSHEPGPLLRSKEMLQQSHARIAGIVFNDLREDLHNWSSYGPGIGAPHDSKPAEPAARKQPLGLVGPPRDKQCA